MDLNYNIRAYQHTDLQDLLAVWESASAAAHAFLPTTFFDEERWHIPNTYLPNADTWVAEYEGRVVGFISLIGSEVGAIFVDSSFHGAGVGSLLMDKARELHPILEVEVFEANKLGRRFYQRYGFKPLPATTHEESGHKLLRLKYSATGELS